MKKSWVLLVVFAVFLINNVQASDAEEVFYPDKVVGILDESAKKQFDLLKLEPVFTGKHKDWIKWMDFTKNNLLLSVSGRKVKIWDLSKGTLVWQLDRPKDYHDSHFIKARLSDSQKGIVYILSTHKFTVYDYLKGKKVWEIRTPKSTLGSFGLSDDEVLMVLNGKGNMFSKGGFMRRNAVFDLNRHKLLYKTYSDEFLSDTDRIMFSPSNDYFLLPGKNRLKVYKVADGAKYSYRSYYLSDDKKDACFLSENHAVVWNKRHDFRTLDLKAKRWLKKFVFKRQIQSISVPYDCSKELYAVLSDLDAESDMLVMLNIRTGQVIKAFDLPGKIFSSQGLKFSDDNRYLAVAFEDGKFNVYDTNQFSSQCEMIKNKSIVSKSEAVSVQTQPTTPVGTKVIVVRANDSQLKKKSGEVSKDGNEKPSHDEKEINSPKSTSPNLIVHASAMKGVVPLKVVFSILTTGKDNIAGYYMNIGGEEVVKKGAPPNKFVKTFNEPGTYDVIIAVKTKEGEIIKRTIQIVPREETFSDFKKRFE